MLLYFPFIVYIRGVPDSNF